MKYSTVAKVSLLTTLIIGIVAGISGFEYSPLKADFLKNPISSSASIILALFVTATLFERAASVFNTVFFASMSSELEYNYQISLTQSKLSALKHGATHSEETANLEVSKYNLEALKEKKKVIRVCIALFAGTLLSASGFQTLAQLINEPSLGHQKQLFTTIDILLTAGLIAGGSQGIAEIIEIFKELNIQNISTKNAESLAPEAVIHRRTMRFEAARTAFLSRQENEKKTDI